MENLKVYTQTYFFNYESSGEKETPWHDHQQ